MAKKPTEASPVVLGGSLTRSPEGRLQTLQTHGQYPSPQGVQQVWSAAKRRRYPDAWDGQALARVGYTIEWEPREISCGKCVRSLGRYVAYRTRHQAEVDEETGVVEDTSRARTAQATNRRFTITGEVARRAAKTTA